MSTLPTTAPARTERAAEIQEVGQEKLSLTVRGRGDHLGGRLGILGDLVEEVREMRHGACVKVMSDPVDVHVRLRRNLVPGQPEGEATEHGEDVFAYDSPGGRPPERCHLAADFRYRDPGRHQQPLLREPCDERLQVGTGRRMDGGHERAC
jgi:hypothetical protein